MDIIKLVCDKKNINGIDPIDIQLAISEYKAGMLNPKSWKLQSSSFDNGITLFNEETFDIKTIGCVLDYFDLGNKNCNNIKGYFNLRASEDCASCINAVLNDYQSGRIKRKNRKEK